MELIQQHEQFPTTYLQFHGMKTERRRKCSGDKNLTLKPSKNNNKPTEGETKKKQNTNQNTNQIQINIRRINK